MSSSISVLSTPTSPLFSEGLTGAVMPRERLTESDRDEMYTLLAAYFSGTDRGRFEADLREKEAVITLRDGGRIVGFTTFMRMTATVDGEPLVAFFSGDTIVAREYWGESVLSRTWGRTIVAEAERSGLPAYWFLICSGYKTWRFLPVFFRQFFPNAVTPAPPRVRRILDMLAGAKFGCEYVRDEGVVRFRNPTPLRPGVADVTDQRRRDPRIVFFERMNPGHSRGDELVCLAEISRANLTRAGLRMIE